MGTYILFFDDNLIDTADLSASTEEPTLPVSKLASPFRGEVWQTTDPNNQYFIADLGSAKPVSSFIAINHNYSGSGTYKIRGNSADSGWESPDFEMDIPFNARLMIALFEEQTLRYWQHLVDDPAIDGGVIQLGRPYLGGYVTPPHNYRYGFSRRPVDLTRISRVRGGQKYRDIGEKYYEIKIDFKQNDDGLVAIETFIEKVGTAKPFFVALNYDRYPNTWTYYASMAGLPEYVGIGETKYQIGSFMMEEEV